MRRPRAEAIADTRARLIGAARRAFAEQGYANAAMEELVAEAGLTRGALYHQFGGKPGLLEAVIEQIDAEMDQRIAEVAADISDPWDNLVARLNAYVAMAAEPEIQRIVLIDGPAVLGNPSQWRLQTACAENTRTGIEALIADGIIDSEGVDAEAMAHLISAAALGASMWVANTPDPRLAAAKVAASLPRLLSGLVSGSGIQGNVQQS